MRAQGALNWWFSPCVYFGPEKRRITPEKYSLRKYGVLDRLTVAT